MDNHHFLWVNPFFLWPFSMAMLNYKRVERDNSSYPNNHHYPHPSTHPKPVWYTIHSVVWALPGIPPNWILISNSTIIPMMIIGFLLRLGDDYCPIGTYWNYPLVNVNEKLWKDPPFCSWVNPLCLWPFSIAMFDITRGYSALFSPLSQQIL